MWNVKKVHKKARSSQNCFQFSANVNTEKVRKLKLSLIASVSIYETVAAKCSMLRDREEMQNSEWKSYFLYMYV